MKPLLLLLLCIPTLVAEQQPLILDLIAAEEGERLRLPTRKDRLSFLKLFRESKENPDIIVARAILAAEREWPTWLAARLLSPPRDPKNNAERIWDRQLRHAALRAFRYHADIPIAPLLETLVAQETSPSLIEAIFFDYWHRSPHTLIRYTVEGRSCLQDIPGCDVYVLQTRRQCVVYTAIENR